MEEDLYEACAMGDTLKLRRLLEEDNSVLAQMIGRSRDTPLHVVCRYKQKRLASLILGLQPDLAKAKNDNGDTPLHVAARVGELEIIKMLLDACLCVTCMLNRAKESALFIACSCGHLEVALVLCSSIDFLAWDEIGASCLRIAACMGYTEIIQKIVGENPSLARRTDEKGISSLHLATSNGHLGVIKELLGRDPKLSFLRDNDGRTPLHLALIYNQVHVVEEFLSERPRPASFNTLLVTDLVNIADNKGDTILHLAAKVNCLEIIELLLSRPGMKANAVNKEGNTALDILEHFPAVDDDEYVALDVFGKIPARDTDANVALNVVEQIPACDTDANVANDSYGRRMAIIKQLKARERANPASLTDMQLKLMLVAGLILTISFQAVLSPPGGLWQDLVQGNHTNHKPGKAIQSETDPGLFTFFMASDALGFLVALALIPMIMILQKEMLLYVNSLVVLALACIEVAFIVSLVMISDSEPFFRVEVLLLVVATLAGIGWMQWKRNRRPQYKRR